MVITPQFGYDEIVPLHKQHRVLMPQGTTPEFCRHLNALAVSASEFVAAGRDYPIVFVSTEAGKSYAPVVVLGLTESSNLFIGPQGEWDLGVYLPAFVRRYPFCISRSQVDGKPGGERVVCVLKAYLDEGGIALFDASGAPAPRWQSTARLLTEFENDLELTAQMCTALARLKLFEPFIMQVKENDGTGLTLQGMFRVDEARLRELRPASHKALVNMGHMGRIYAHLHSLENFQRLYARSKRR